MSLVVIVEGGTGRSVPAEKKGFGSLFEKVAPGCRPRIKMSKGRSQAIGAYLDEVKKGQNAVLLIDSEGPVDSDMNSLEFLTQPNSRLSDFRLESSKKDDVHLMVQCMESWFFADPRGVKKRVRRLDVGALSKEVANRGNRVELISKTDAQQIFAAACGSSIRKVLHLGFVGELDPKLIAAASPKSALLFKRLNASFEF